MRILPFILLFIFSAAGAQKIQYGNNPAAGQYITHKGAKIYFETYGTGKPLVLIHGNGGSIKSRGNMIEKLKNTYKVIMMDNRCHGKSDCPKGPLNYEQMADDLNAVLNSLKIDSALMWGHSDGAIVGLLEAIHYPVRVRKLLSSGANLRPDTTAVDPAMTPVLDKLYLTAKNDSISLKQWKLLVQEPHIPVKDLHKIKCDVLVMAGDRDVIRNAHTLEIFDNIPGALLCILPATSHFVYHDREAWFMEIMLDFFEKPQNKTTTAVMMWKMLK